MRLNAGKPLTLLSLALVLCWHSAYAQDSQRGVVLEPDSHFQASKAEFLIGTYKHINSNVCLGFGEWVDQEYVYKYPLQLGSIWQYVVTEGGIRAEYVSQEIVGDTLVNNVKYSVMNERRYEIVNNETMSGRVYEITRLMTILDGVLYELIGDVLYGSYNLNINSDSTYSINSADSIKVIFNTYSNIYIGNNNIHNLDYAQYTINGFFQARLVAGIGVVEFFGEGNVYKLLLYANTVCGEVGTAIDFGAISNIEKYEPIIEAYIYPNPVNEGRIRIESVFQIESVTIFDVTGRILRSQNYSIDGLRVSDLAPGLYIIKINYHNGRSHANKIIVGR